MKIETHKHGKICVVDLSGRITMDNVGELHKTFHEMVENGERHIVFDMLDVPWLDSCGIGQVVACKKTAQDHDGEIKLVLKGKTHDLFTFMELHKVFPLFEEMEDALASFAK